MIAISSLLLLNRTEAALTEYLSKLSADFGNNGYFSDEMQTQISSDKKELVKYLSAIKENIVERYRNLGIAVDVKDLSCYVDWNDDGLAGNEVLTENEKVEIGNSVIEVPNEGGEFTIQIDSPISLYLEPQMETDTDNDLQPDVNISTGISFGDLYDGDVTDKEITCESKLNDKILSIVVSALQSRTNRSKTILLYGYIGNVVGSVELTQKGKIMETPLLGEGAMNFVTSITQEIAVGLKEYNLIEQYYNYNKSANTVRDYVFPSSNKINNSWAKIYKANNMLLQLKAEDENRLNVYADYCNVLNALIYSNLVYG